MLFPNDLITPVTDPIERERIATGRPESRWEIARRHLHESRLNAPLQAYETDAPTPSGHDSGVRVVPNPVTGIRRTLSRVLITTGERIDPEAA